MNGIGVDRDTFDIYVRTPNGIWHSVWPDRPVVSVAALFKASSGSAHVESDTAGAALVFREDSFDPVTRVRRGRFYQRSPDPRPSQQWTLPHPVYGSRGSVPVPTQDGRVERWLYIFDAMQSARVDGFAVIGSDESWWRIVGSEKIVSGEYLVTLKARLSLGVLPPLKPGAIPAAGRDKTVETYEKLVDSAYRETPVSIVDRARDAAQWFLATWAAEKYSDSGLLHADLSELIKKVDLKSETGNAGEKPEVTLSTARVIARLHARGKPNEQDKRNLRPLMEVDAEFALAAMGLLVREFGWA